MADLDIALASAVQAGGQPALRAVLESGLTSEILEGEGKTAYEYIVEFYKQYSAIPTPDVVVAQTGVVLVPTPDPVAYLVDSLFSRKLHNILHSGTLKLLNDLESHQPKKGRETVEDLLRTIRKYDTRGALVESLPALGDRVVDYYEKIKRGERGIQTPWPTINEATMGFWPEDLALFVARMGIGKTWSALQIAGCAWEQGKKVLVATTEMTKERMAMRYFACKLRLPYGDFRRGKLDIFTEQKFYNGVQQLMNSPNFNIVGGDFDFAMETFAGIVMDEKPDIVIVDGAYLLKVPGLTRTERAANVFDELKRLAKRSKAAVIATMQFNREVKTNQAKTVQADAIAMTDVAGWNADLIFGLIQTEDMKKNKRMAFKPLKVREGEAEEIECNWDFEQMLFDELPKANFGSGVAITGSNIPTNDSDLEPF